MKPLQIETTYTCQAYWPLTSLNDSTNIFEFLLRQHNYIDILSISHFSKIFNDIRCRLMS